MAILKCKMCGGDLTIQDGMTVAECEYCGTTQTLPKLVSDDIANLYDRANHFRRNNEFDKAEGIYERILSQTPEDSEAYWSLVLCRYGIEYVEDPATGKRVPTVNRTQYTSVFDDENYKSAIEHADAIQRRVYEEEAAAINEIQKGILAISQKEEPFDVFICYKETDRNGRRTPDSVLATDLYHQLTNEGFKVFFARITLEDKLGSAYEPYIFAALNSAKVMVVLGTKPEYFNAVWVKNEWSRYLALVNKSGGKKVLIPAYRDMDPYDLPEEFSHLQAQDMSKLGFMQDLIRGIKKITGSDKPKAQTQVVSTVAGASDVAPLLKRMFMYLEDGEWDKANEYAERVLDKNPENAEAYVGKLMVDLKVRRRESLKDQAQPFDKNKHYQKAIRFGDDNLKNELNDYIDYINKRNAESKYVKACELQKIGGEQNFGKALEIFRTLKNYNDSAERAEECQRAYEARKAERIKRETKERQEREEREARKRAAAAELERAKTEKFSAMQKAAPRMKRKLSTGSRHTIGLNDDGTVIAVGENDKGQCSLGHWADIVQTAAGYAHSLGLKADGTVVASGSNGYGQCNTSGWKNIIEIAAGSFVSFGLRNDGKVLAVGEIDKCYVSEWNDIISIAAESDFIVGLKSNGTVVATGDNYFKQCDVGDWENIIAIAAGENHTVGLKADGTVVAVGFNGVGQCDVSLWRKVVAITAGYYHTVGLCADGNVYVTKSYDVGYNKYGECNVKNWRKIVGIAACFTHTIGLKDDGSVVAVGENDKGQCNVSGWKLIKTHEEKYSDACNYQASGSQDGINRALTLFKGLGYYKDSPTRAKSCTELLLNGEKASLQQELSNLKGLFTIKRRQQIKARLAEIELELKKL